MNIVPDFDEAGLFPIAIGKLQKHHSPYFVDIATVAERLAASEERRFTIFNLLRYRAEFYRLGFLLGTHFVGGELVERAEPPSSERRAPLPLATYLIAPAGRINPLGMRARLDDIARMAEARYRIVGPIFAQGIDDPVASMKGMTRAAFNLSATPEPALWKGLLSIPMSQQDDAAVWSRLSRAGAGGPAAAPEAAPSPHT